MLTADQGMYAAFSGDLCACVCTLVFWAVSILLDLHSMLLMHSAWMLQVLANILSNAVKFTHAGEVVINATCSEPVPAVPRAGEPGSEDGVAGKQLVHISIRDTGIGISEESMAKLFQCFRQGSESMSRKYGGTGGSPSLWKSS